MAASCLLWTALGCTGPLHDATNIIVREDFHTVTEPLSRTNRRFGTRPHQQRSLVLSGEKRDETSLRSGPRSVTVGRFGRLCPEVGRRVSRRSRRDGAPGRATVAGGPADPVHAGCEPDEMAQGAHHVVLGAVRARRALCGLPALSP